MIGFLTATHGDFARGIPDSTELIAGKQKHIDTVSILHGANVDVLGKEFTDKIVELDDGDGMVVFCDLPLASPYNQATMSYCTLQGRHEYRIMSGANLPMILEALNGYIQNLGLDTVGRMTQNTGKEGIQGFFEEFAGVSDTDIIQ